MKEMTMILFDKDYNALGKANYDRWNKLPWYKHLLGYFFYCYKRKFIDIEGFEIKNSKIIYKITTSPQSMTEDSKIDFSYKLRFDDWLETKGVILLEGGYGNSDLCVMFASYLGDLVPEKWFEIEKITKKEYDLLKLN